MGEVTIRSNIQGEEVKEYQAEIVRIYPENEEDTRNFLIKVTDKELAYILYPLGVRCQP